MIHFIKYTLKVWLTAVFATPAIIIIFKLMPSNGLDQTLLILTMGIIVGMFYSIPSALLLGLIAYIVTDCRINRIYKKTILSATGIALTFLAFLLFNDLRPPKKDDITFFIVYALVIVSGIWFYKLETETAVVGND